MIRKFALAVLMTVMVASLGACGRKATPDYPAGSNGPRQYPTE
jgi:predicted small lipoprotein YifL